MFQDPKKPQKESHEESFGDVVTPDDDGIAVGSGEMLVASQHAGPCTIIGMLDRASSQAVLGHFPRPNDNDEGCFEKMLEVAASTFKVKGRVEVFLAGCSVESDRPLEKGGAGYGRGDAARSRKATIAKIVDAGYDEKKISKRWLKTEGASQEMMIVLAGKRVIIETSPLTGQEKSKFEVL